MMHVIGLDEELPEALNRAPQIERNVAETALARAARYEEMLPSAPISPISDLVVAEAEEEEVERQSYSA
jgi:hypothetical protein